jgi:putative multiple sugar transport system permease protein
MAVLNNGLQLSGVGSDKTQVIKGLVLLVAVAFDVYSKVQGKPSIIGLIFPSRRDRGPGAVEGADAPQAEIPVKDGATAAKG